MSGRYWKSFLGASIVRLYTVDGRWLGSVVMRNDESWDAYIADDQNRLRGSFTKDEAKAAVVAELDRRAQEVA
jgi:hypothetical protein